MKVIRIKCLKSYNAIIAFLISFFGFASSCNPLGGTNAMYGTPSANFIVNGKIKSKADNMPIPGIKVQLSKEYTSVDQNFVYPLDSVFSSSAGGTYKVTAKDQFPEDQTFNVSFTDVDGALNGEFEPLDTAVVFRNPKFSNGSGSWYQGETEVEFDVKLRPKQ